MDMEFPKVNDKLAFFDFDRTLVAHEYSDEYAREAGNGYFAECLRMLTSMKKEHENDRPLPCMQWYANKLFEDGYGIYVLTHEIFNLRDSLKKAQLKEFYPDVPMAYLTVDSPEHKIDMMAAVAASEGCSLSDVIFVDDRMATVKLALAAGIDAKHLSDVVVMYENSRACRQQGSVLRMDGACGDDGPKLFEGNGPDADAWDGFGISKENLEEIYLDCRHLAEMNGRDGNGMDGGASL